MNYSSIQKSLDYIESHLETNIELERVAEKAGYSLYHFHRIFSGIAGYTLKEYIRKRRLTRSARMLQFTQKSISEISQLCGFRSQEAFTRAFSKHFSCTPHRFRKSDSPFDYTNQIKVGETESNTFEIKVRTKEVADFSICGLSARVSPNNPKLKTLWADLWKYADSFDMQNCNGFYALSTSTEVKSDLPIFDYLVGLKPEYMRSIPDGFVTREVKGGTFLIFEYKEGLDKLDDYFLYLFSNWLPANGYKARDFDLEFYNKTFSAENEDSVIAIMVSVEKINFVQKKSSS